MNIKKSQQKIKSDGSYFCCHMHKKKDRVSSTLLRTRFFKSCFIKSSLSCIKLSDIVLYLLWWILCGNFILPNGYRPCLFLWNWICEINYTLSCRALMQKSQSSISEGSAVDSTFFKTNVIFHFFRDGYAILV